MSKEKKAMYIRLILLFIVIVNSIYMCIISFYRFSSPKLLFLFNNRKIPNLVVEGDNSAFVANVSLFNNAVTYEIYKRVDDKYKKIIFDDVNFIYNENCRKNDIHLTYYKYTNDFYLEIIYPSKYGNIKDFINSNYECYESKDYNTCYVYIKNYRDGYVFELNDKKYKIDL